MVMHDQTQSEPGIAALKAAVDAAWDRVREAQDAHSIVEDAYEAALSKQMGIVVGMLVKGTGTKAGVYRVTRWRHWDSGAAWLSGQRQRGDGSFTDKEFNLYADWIKAEAEPA